MATRIREQVRWSRNLSGGPAPIQHFPEAITQSVPAGSVIGQICDLTGGRLRKAGATGLHASLATGSSIVGVMADPFTLLTATSDVVSDRLGVVVASSETRFRGHVYRGSGNIAQADGGNQSLTAGMVGTAYGLINLSHSGGSGVWAVNTGQTSVTYVKVTQLIHDVGDINGAVEFVFENDKIVYGD